MNYEIIPFVFVFVEKQSTVTLMSPYAEPVGISFIDSEGFGSGGYAIYKASVLLITQDSRRKMTTTRFTIGDLSIGEIWPI